MRFMERLEKMIIEWLREVPHLPPNVRKWLGSNAWWLVLLGVMLQILAVLGLMRELDTLSRVNVAVQQYSAYSPYLEAATQNTTMTLVSMWISLVALVGVVILDATAISHLKEMKRRGWKLLFIGAVVATISSVASAVLTLQVAGLLTVMISTAIGMYVLFEVRTQFMDPKPGKGNRGE